MVSTSHADERESHAGRSRVFQDDALPPSLAQYKQELWPLRIGDGSSWWSVEQRWPSARGYVSNLAVAGSLCRIASSDDAAGQCSLTTRYRIVLVAEAIWPKATFTCWQAARRLEVVACLQAQQRKKKEGPYRKHMQAMQGDLLRLWTRGRECNPISSPFHNYERRGDARQDVWMLHRMHAWCMQEPQICDGDDGDDDEERLRMA
jgi:hypothetical protein